uniref:Uncharacterized protein n=1 Tax=Planktothricoides sp. SpSt-374 TaxID=2282167 RepID=A0A7C3VRJ8_9CYAN
MLGSSKLLTAVGSFAGALVVNGAAAGGFAPAPLGVGVGVGLPGAGAAAGVSVGEGELVACSSEDSPPQALRSSNIPRDTVNERKRMVGS